MVFTRSLLPSSRSRFQYYIGRHFFNTKKDEIFQEKEAKKEEDEFSDVDGAFSDSIGGKINRSLIWLIDILDRRIECIPIQCNDIPSAGGLLILKCPSAKGVKEDVKLTLCEKTLVFQAGKKYERIIKLPVNYNCIADELKAEFKNGILKIRFPKKKEGEEVKI